MKKKDRKKENFKDAKFKIRDVVNIKIPSKLSSFQSEILGWILKHN
jgi:hypothetical protein